MKSRVKQTLQNKLEEYSKAEEFFTTKLSEYSEKLSDTQKAKLWNEIYPMVKDLIELKLKEGYLDRKQFNQEVADKIFFVLFGVDFQKMIDKLL